MGFVSAGVQGGTRQEGDEDEGEGGSDSEDEVHVCTCCHVGVHLSMNTVHVCSTLDSW